jgi:hypothetical protein
VVDLSPAKVNGLLDGGGPKAAYHREVILAGALFVPAEAGTVPRELFGGAGKEGVSVHLYALHIVKALSIWV